MARPGIELAWRHFACNLTAQNYDAAYRWMSQDYRTNHSEAEFVEAWLDYDSRYLVTSNRAMNVVYIGLLSPIRGESKVFISSSHLYLPLPLEDGFMGTHANLKKEDGLWKIRDFPFGVEGR